MGGRQLTRLEFVDTKKRILYSTKFVLIVLGKKSCKDKKAFVNKVLIEKRIHSFLREDANKLSISLCSACSLINMNS